MHRRLLRRVRRRQLGPISRPRRRLQEHNPHLGRRRHPATRPRLKATRLRPRARRLRATVRRLRAMVRHRKATVRRRRRRRIPRCTTTTVCICGWVSVSAT